MEEALDQIDAWMESPSLVILGEPRDHCSILRKQLAAGQIEGAMVHDARVAALCIGHGISESLPVDRDFGRFSPLPTRNPLVR